LRTLARAFLVSDEKEAVLAVLERRRLLGSVETESSCWRSLCSPEFITIGTLGDALKMLAHARSPIALSNSRFDLPGIDFSSEFGIRYCRKRRWRKIIIGNMLPTFRRLQQTRQSPPLAIHPGPRSIADAINPDRRPADPRRPVFFAILPLPLPLPSLPPVGETNVRR